ncbi:hypothetical protein SCP_0510660 [Sparassis crispa]|uniref:RING-type domain-containing protein n=1 Tax=Sparassis crispa TaxID=139825 RepID=A0A401GP60_9APHY|nr:hypothetical protein SCP_0510660 [Sparassis crispa]GBE84007.1 hypothetical protein SCP_0510660 [Sparassis crispa]
MSASTQGLPLLSGPPPEYSINETSCRKCDKEFNVLFTRARKCNHCGYSYCHSCTDYQALMPRSGQASGYDVVPICAFCVENLTITAAGKGRLKQLPLSKLRKYAAAYGIKVNGVVEKDDFIDTLMAARLPNGCLPPFNEELYRKYAVPNRRTERPRGIFTRAMDAMNPERGSSTQPPPPPPPQQRQRPSYQPRQRTTSGPSTFPRPDLDPRLRPHPQQYAPRGQARSQYPHARASPRPNVNVTSNNNSQSRGRAASAGARTVPHTTTSPAPPVPTLDELLEMPVERVAGLSIGTLKAVLFQNHVNARLVVEKAELVAKVCALVEDEREERARKAAEEEAEEEEVRRQAAAVQETVVGDSEDEDEVLSRVLEESRRMAEEHEWAQAEHEEQMQADPDAMEVDEDEPREDEDEHDAGVHATAASAPVTPPGASSDAPQTHAMPATSPSTPQGAHAAAPHTRLSPAPQAMAARLERTGMCVICQDEEANIAIVDCGHMAMCRACSDLIMQSTRECPLCRTRIVTESRLLRIFKT